MVRYILLTAEILLLIIFCIPIYHGILNPGNIVGILVSVCLGLITIYFDRFCRFIADIFKSAGGKVFVISTALIVGAAVIYASVLSVFMVKAQLKAPKNTQAVIVLGCKVNGTQPSRMLCRRLDSALKFLQDNPDAVCVVSGGKGDDEQISEALAMKNYLMEKGISYGRIIMEDKSATTAENLQFSSEILSVMDIHNVAIVTDGFHQYRASIIGEKYGLECCAVNAESDKITKWLIPTYWVREWMAITKEYLA